ncbi:MAG: hypothetical protein J7K64_02115 [Bacteroidales bacterium]|nr:hypothetical protein [Bacteroidales bacterium]
MNTAELQNNIIHKILDIKNNDLLSYVYSLLKKEKQKKYILSEFEKTIIEESLADYKSGKAVDNDDFHNKTQEWLEE